MGEETWVVLGAIWIFILIVYEKQNVVIFLGECSTKVESKIGGISH